MELGLSDGIEQAPSYERMRYERLQQKMAAQGIDHLLIEDPLEIYYLTGCSFSAASFLAHRERAADLLVDSRYFDSLRPNYWRSWRMQRDLWPSFWQQSRLCSLAFDSARSSYDRFLELEGVARQHGIELYPLKGALESLQELKDEQELAKMQVAGHLASEVLDAVCDQLQEGVSEKEISRSIQLLLLERDAELAFDPIVAFGDHAAIPHHISSERRLEKGQIVLIDLGARWKRYCSDMTRSFFFREVGSSQLQQLWKIVHEAFELACDKVGPGVSCRMLDQVVREYFRSHQLEERFTHSLGHGIGLRVHEAPAFRRDSDSCLHKASVITIEPGLYLPGVGGVRLENTLVVTASGAEALTSYPFQLVL